MRNQIIFLFLILPIYSEAAGKLVKVKSIQGSGQVQLERNSTFSSLRSTEDLQANDILMTDANSTVELTYQDGSSQTISTSSKIKILPSENGAPSSFLDDGTTTVQVSKDSQHSKNHKFYIHTKTAVMGVRGTLFVVDAKSAATGETTLHTLEGVVDIALDQKTLISGKSTAVGPNEMVRAQGNILETKKPFNPTTYMNQMQSAHPNGFQMIQREMRSQLPPRPQEVNKNQNINERKEPKAPGKEKASGPQKGAALDKAPGKSESLGLPPSNNGSGGSGPHRGNNGPGPSGNGPGSGNNPGAAGPPPIGPGGNNPGNQPKPPPPPLPPPQT